MLHNSQKKLKHFFILLIFVLLTDCGYSQQELKKIDSLFDKTQILYSNRMFYESIRLLDSIGAKLEQLKDIQEKDLYYYKIADFFIEMKDKELSLKYLYKGLNNLEKRIPNTDTASFLYIYDLSGNPIYQKFESSEKRNKIAVLYCNYYNRLGGAFYNANEFEKAKQYWHKTNKIATNNNLIRFQSIALNNIADTYNNDKKHLQAGKLYRRSFQLAELTKNKSSIAYIGINLAFYFLNVSQLDSAYQYYSFHDYIYLCVTIIV